MFMRLPLFFNSFAFLVFASYFALGFGSFVVGTLLIWWGLVRTSHDIEVRQNSHPV